MLLGVSRAEYPERPITLICNYTPGGGADLSSRALAKNAEKILGQPIVVVNKPGAGGMLGVTEIAAARPDGYTIGLTSFSPLTLIPHMQDVSYDPINSFDYIMSYAKWMFGICVRSDSPFKTLKDLVEYAKSNPKKIKYTTVGIASVNTFGMVNIAKAQGIEWDYVVFKGGPEAIIACLGGHVDVSSTSASEAIPYIKAGRMRLLVAMSDTRWQWVPDVPTIRELGHDIYVPGAYLALGVPKGVPTPILEKLRRVFKQTMDVPEFLKIIESVYLQVEYHTADEYKKLVEEGYKENEKIILKLGLHKSQKK
jgi:tripartite-type tricarboxylate transporter receptor subunit TctC